MQLQPSQLKLAGFLFLVVWLDLLELLIECMKLFEATIRTADGREFKDRVGADTAQAARFLLQQRYGPRAVPYLPKMIPG
jgi:hypothetical protein